MLAPEIIIKRGAEKLGITVTEEKIETALLNEARGDSETISKREFDEWYRQRLNESQLTDAEYKDFYGVNLLVDKLNRILKKLERDEKTMGRIALV